MGHAAGAHALHLDAASGELGFLHAMNLIKAGFSRRAKSFFHVDEWMNDSKRKHRETTIWHRRFWEHQIRDEREYPVFMDYTHFNSGKHRLVERVVDWPYSTFQRCVKLGIYPEN